MESSNDVVKNVRHNLVSNETCGTLACGSLLVMTICVVSLCCFLEKTAFAGSVAAWGHNYLYAQCDVPEPNSGFSAIAAGGFFSLGIKDDGRIEAWGKNDYGECNVPAPNSDFIAISAGVNHGLGLKTDGSVRAWGLNDEGQCDIPSPNADFVAIAGGGYGGYISLGLKEDGSIVVWGRDLHGQLNVPVPNTGFKAMAAGERHCLGLKEDGSIVAWGSNGYGQCDVPQPNSGFTAITAGGQCSLGLKEDGSIVAWGRNDNGQCDVPEPNSGYVAISAGYEHALALRAEGSVEAWGRNDYGQADVPTLWPNVRITHIAAGGFHNLALTTDGLLFPNGGEELIAGQTVAIEWCSGLAEDANVVLEYSTNNGQDWNEIDIVANTGAYDWVVPQVTFNQCLIKISDETDSNIYDTSDDVFTIYVCQLSSLARDADLDDNCKVNFIDFSLWSQQWLKNGNPFDPGYTEGPGGMVWISINDPGVAGHEGFSGEMSKYETTNAQYCEFLNAAIASGDITVSGSSVIGANGSNTGADHVGKMYYDLAGYGYSHDGAADGGAARISYNGGVFSVESDFENHPVTYVSWYGSDAFCNYYGYRLPSEWEWQAVADYNGTYTYGCGTSINSSITNYIGSIHPYGTTAVGDFGAYGYGMCDMAGNVWEWTSSISTGSYRVFRGGGWFYNEVGCNVSFRGGDGPSQEHGYYAGGFRAVRRAGTGPEGVAFHVDGERGDDGNDGLSRETAFLTIQKGIDTAEDGNVVLVWPGVYVERIFYYGKGITVTSADYPAVIEAPWQDAVSFIVSEGPGSVLSNFVIRRSMTAIACNNRSSPTLKNLTIVDNNFGIAAYEGSSPNIINCILWLI